MHKGRHWGVGLGGFGCREGFWEEAHGRVHDRAQKIRASKSVPEAKGVKTIMSAN